MMLPSTSLASSLATAVTVLLLAHTTQAWAPPFPPQLMGCYSSSQGLTFNATETFQSSGACKDLCGPANKAVMAMTGQTDCWCGDQMPPLSTKVADSMCNSTCPGWPGDICGSPSGAVPAYFSVWKSGLLSSVINSDLSPSAAASGASSTTSSAASVVTVKGQTVVVTASSSSTTSSVPSGDSSGPSTAGIAAGVVVGILAISGIAGGIWFYMRARRRRELEEDHKRQAAVTAIVRNKPGSSAGSSHDTRLDPVIMTQRRMSDGSIADNQDYSRRILKVTNA